MSKFTKIATQDGFVTERIAVHKNRLLGNYDNEGNYYIVDKIKKELRKMEKVKKTTYDNSLFCVANNLGIGELLFQISYDKKIVDGKVGSKLYLLEDVYKANGYYINTIKTEIAEYEDVVSNYMEKSYGYYNVIIDGEDREKDVDDLDFSDIGFPYTLAKRQYEQAIFKNMEEEVYKLYEEYLDVKIATLKDMKNDFASVVLGNYDKEVNAAKDRFLTAGEDNNKQAYNELFDMAVESRVAVRESENKYLEDYKKAIYEPTIKLADSYNKELEESKKVARKKLSRSDYEFVKDIESALAEHNSKIDIVAAWDCGFVDESELKKDNAALTKNLKDKLSKLVKPKEKEALEIEEEVVEEEIIDKDSALEEESTDEVVTELVEDEFANIILDDTEYEKEEKKKKKKIEEKEKKQEENIKKAEELAKINEEKEKFLEDERSM